MSLHRSRLISAIQSSFVVAGLTASAWAAKPNPTAQDALQLKPVQLDVSAEQPEKEQLAACTLENISQDEGTGFVVRNAAGQILRRFVDTNKDGKLDVWSYYQQGVEIYRDIDSDFDGRADQYRWLGTAGIRWGLDQNQDGKIDRWKMISAEEVSAEVVDALRQKDADRFQRLLLTSEELKALGLSESRTREIELKLKAARDGFKELAQKQKTISSKSEWTNFGATQPGVFPAGTDGSTKDLIIYENAAALVSQDGKSSQLPIGTLIQVGSNWRLMELPALEGSGSGPAGNFFVQLAPKTEANSSAESAITPEMQKLITEMEKLDRQQASAGVDQLPAIFARRADTLESLYALSANDEDKANWIHQLADVIGAAVQAGNYPSGVARLKQLTQKLTEDKTSEDEIAYVTFRTIMAEHDLGLQDPKADYEKLQNALEERLQQFITDYAAGSSAPEAMMQLAAVYEFSGKDEEAVKLYGRVLKDHGQADQAKKAAGAKFRLECVGKPMTLRAKSIDAKGGSANFDLNQARGNVVLIHYWATWCERCLDDMAKLRELQAKYGRDGFTLVGVSLDTESKAAVKHLQSARLPWTQLHEQGGMEGRLAHEMGIINLPTMILVDKDGKVISRDIHTAQLESELAKLIKQPVGNARKPTTKGATKSTK